MVTPLFMLYHRDPSNHCGLLVHHAPRECPSMCFALAPPSPPSAPTPFHLSHPPRPSTRRIGPNPRLHYGCHHRRLYPRTPPLRLRTPRKHQVSLFPIAVGRPRTPLTHSPRDGVTSRAWRTGHAHFRAYVHTSARVCMRTP
jgi:hypothetical protein